MRGGCRYHTLPFLTHPHRNVNAKTMCKVWYRIITLSLLTGTLCTLSSWMCSLAPTLLYSTTASYPDPTVPFTDLFPSLVPPNHPPLAAVVEQTHHSLTMIQLIYTEGYN